MAKDVKAGAAYVELYTKDSRLEAGLRAAQGKLKAWGAAMSTVGATAAAGGAALLAPLLATARLTQSTGAALADMATRLKMPVEQLSELSYAAQLSGVELEELARRAKALTPEAAAMAPILADLSKEARSLGLTLSTSDAKGAEQFGQALGTLRQIVKMAATQLGAALLPELMRFRDWALRAATGLNLWVKNNRELVGWLARLAAIVAAGGVALVGFGAAIGVAGTVLGGLATAIGAVGAVVGALLTPIGLAGVAIAGLAAYFLSSTDVISQASQMLSQAWGTLRDDATRAFGGIAKALSAGDITLAAKILWTTLKLEFKRGIGALESYWIDFKAFFQSVWNEAVLGTASILTKTWSGLRSTWYMVVDALADAWHGFADTMASVYLGAVNVIKKSLAAMNPFGDEGRSAEIDAETDGAMAELTDAQTKAKREREAKRRERDQDLQTDGAGALGEIEAERRRRQAEVDGRRATSQQALQDELKALERERDALTARANAADQARGDLPQTKSRIDELKALLARTGSARVVGTFSAAGAAQIGGRDQVAENTRNMVEQQRLTNRKLSKLEQGGRLAVGFF